MLMILRQRKKGICNLRKNLTLCPKHVGLLTILSVISSSEIVLKYFLYQCGKMSNIQKVLFTKWNITLCWLFFTAIKLKSFNLFWARNQISLIIITFFLGLRKIDEATVTVYELSQLNDFKPRKSFSLFYRLSAPFLFLRRKLMLFK